MNSTLQPTIQSREANLADFAAACFGLFIHYGLYSMLERGEWVLNREGIAIDEYRALADRFDPSNFDATAIARLARQAGCKYLCFTTMHHDGFCLYDSKLTDFTSVQRGPKRDLTAELVEACRREGLRVHLYHSLNHWLSKPDGVDALESETAKRRFVDAAHARVRELLELFNPIECLWYDGWWPFDAEGWRAREMNELALSIQPHLIFNGRNGLPGDFATPEQHLGPPKPYRPWEACITHNNNWSCHRGDQNWKSSRQVLDMLTQVAAGGGNLLFNVGPDPTGAIPNPSVEVLTDIGRWLELNREAIETTEPLQIDPHDPAAGRGDWMHHGRYTARGNTLYLILSQWPGTAFSIHGLDVQVNEALMLHDGAPVNYVQAGRRVTFSELSADPPTPLAPVIALRCDQPPKLALCGGLRMPAVPYPRYDPVASDLPW